jgi:DNA-binding transcriptional ArsR family regulator
MDDRVVLDRESFKALAAESRIKILKELHRRRQMQAELAHALGLALPSVKEHLDALEKAGLIVKKEEGRKWKYYELTMKGKAVLDPEQKKFWIILSLFILSAAGGLSAYARVLLAQFYNPPVQAFAKTASLAAPLAPGPEAADAGTLAATAAPGTVIPWGIIIYGAWLVLLAGMLIYSYVQRKKYEGIDLTKSQTINK